MEAKPSSCSVFGETFEYNNKRQLPFKWEWCRFLAINPYSHQTLKTPRRCQTNLLNSHTFCFYVFIFQRWCLTLENSGWTLGLPYMLTGNFSLIARWPDLHKHALPPCRKWHDYLLKILTKKKKNKRAIGWSSTSSVVSIFNVLL